MKSFFFFIVTCITTAIAISALENIGRRQHDKAFSFHSTHKRGISNNIAVFNSTCRASTQGIIIFSVIVGDLTVTGKGFGSLPSSGQEISLNVVHTAGGATVMNYTANVSAAGVYSGKWFYGNTVAGGIRNATLVTVGNITEGTVNGRAIVPFTKQNDSKPLTFTDGTHVPIPVFPVDIAAAFNQFPQAAQAALNACHPIDTRETFANTTILTTRQQSSFGSPPHFDNTDSSTNCVACIAEAYGIAAGCGLACAASFGIACGCVIGVPALFAQCHTPGTGFGQGCCPVGCGPVTDIAFIGVVQQCCSENDSCLNSANGLCCGPGLQTCNSKTCCPSNAPCRDLGICCPTTQNTCLTSSGPVCCEANEDCVQGHCCPTSTTVVNGQCCFPSGACGSACCNAPGQLTSMFCADSRRSLCCLTGEVEVNGICCSPGELNCNGVCCGGTCSGPQGTCVLNSAACVAEGGTGQVCPAGVCLPSGVCQAGCCFSHIIPK